MESLKRVFLFILVGLFLINFSSAGLFDPSSELVFHEDGKNGKYGYYEINSTDFWFFNNKPVKTIELIENEYSVFTAWNIKEIEIFRSTKLFDKTNYLDKTQKKDRSGLISSETHLYREWVTKTRVIPSFECLGYDTIVNGSNSMQVCSGFQDNSYEEEYEEWSKWETYNFQIVQEGLYQTKTIVTRNSQNTGVIDWVDENEGWDLDEWETWWDNDWAFKREISTLNGTISALYNITWVTGMKADFGDLRFLDFSTESIELNYTIVNKIDSTTSMIRINNLGESQIYMYYGNPSVSTAGNAGNVFFNTISGYFFDNANVNDFSGTDNMTIGGANFISSGYIGGAYNLDGTNDYLSRAKLSSGAFSISLWLNMDLIHSSKNDRIFDMSDGTGIIMYFDSSANGATTTRIFDGSGDSRVDTAAGTFSSGAGWQHLVVTSNSAGDLEVWVDGVNKGNNSAGGSMVTSSSKDLYFGQSGTGGDYLDAQFDEIYIYNKELTPTQIMALHNQTESSFIVGLKQQLQGVLTTLISPENNENVLSNTVNFTFTSIPNQVNLTNATLYVWYNNGTLTETQQINLTGNESINTTLVEVLLDGMYKWNAETCGESVDCSFATSNNSFIVHITPITIDISEPNGTIPYILLGDNQTLTWQLTEPGENLTEHVTNCSFTYNSVITFLPLSTCIVTNTTVFEYINGVNTLTFNTTDIFNLTSSQITTWDYTIIELNQTFEENITEGELDDFSLLLNISDSSSLTDATFSFNGTNYTTTIIFSSGLYLISSMIVSPTVESDTNFSFNFFFVVDGINYSTLVNQQLVLNSLFDVCGGISNDTLLNMSLVDEESGLSITGTIEIVADITSKSSGVTVGTINNTFENVEYAAICFTPASAYPSYNLNTEIRYSSDGYVSELYYIQNSDMEEYPRNLTLLDLNQTDSTEFVITFQNDAFILVEDAVIQLQRKYIGENVYKVVEAPRTSDGGKAIVHIDLNTNIYRASVVKDGVLLKFFDDIVFSCENELAGECTEQLRGDVNPNNDVPIETILDFSYSVSVSDENNTVTVLFAVPSGTPSSINVLLTQIDMFGNSTSCNTTVITSAGSITCDFSDTIEKSILQLTISKDGTQLAITNYGVDPELDMDGMNFFIVFLFLISLVGMAIASPEWMMIIGVMVFMISGTLLLLQGMSLAMGLGAMAWLVVVVIIIILKMAKQEDR